MHLGVCGRIWRVWGVCVSFISFDFSLDDSYSGSSGFLFSHKVKSLIRMLSNAYEFHFYTILLLDITVSYELSLFFRSCLPPADVLLYVWLTLSCILVEMHSRVRVEDVSRERRDCRSSLWTQP
jgi:hypothetical protein